MVGGGANLLRVGGLIDGTEVSLVSMAGPHQDMSYETDLYCDTENRAGLDVPYTYFSGNVFFLDPIAFRRSTERRSGCARPCQCFTDDNNNCASPIQNRATFAEVLGRCMPSGRKLCVESHHSQVETFF